MLFGPTNGELDRSLYSNHQRFIVATSLPASQTLLYVYGDTTTR